VSQTDDKSLTDAKILYSWFLQRRLFSDWSEQCIYLILSAQYIEYNIFNGS